ncbi:MAG: hypothetical protein K0U37_04700 [Gammaproteobacteria bacterium]|nr:hypothetical protein [Gammaproteobacteria bacterium]
MTLFSEVSLNFILCEIQTLIDASLAADKKDNDYNGLFQRDHELAKNKRDCLETFRTTIKTIESSDDETYKTDLFQNLDKTKTELDTKRQQANQEANTTEKTLRIIQDFITDLFAQLSTLKLLDTPVSSEPMCEVYRAIISYLANRTLNKAQETAGTHSMIHRFLHHPSVTDNTAFLSALDNLIIDNVDYIQDTLTGYASSDEQFQRRKDRLASRVLRSLELEHKALREDPKYSRLGFCLPDNLSAYIETAKQNIAHCLVTEIEEKELSA